MSVFRTVFVVGAIVALSAPGNSALHAQGVVVGSTTQVITQPDGSVTVIEMADQSASAAAAGPNTSADGKPAAASRLEQLKKLTYDRRPSTILRAWADKHKPSESDNEQKPAEKEESPDEADAERPDKTDAATDAPADEQPPEEEKTEEQKQAEAEAAAAAEEQKQQAEALAAELKELQTNVTFGNWPEVESYFAGLPEEEGKAGYAQMLRSLGSPPGAQPGQPQQQQQVNLPGIGPVSEQHRITLDDLIEIASACPHELDRDTVNLLGRLARLTAQNGALHEALIARLEHEAQRPEAERILSSTHCAWLLSSAGHMADVGPFLPSMEESIAAEDADTLLLTSHTLQAQYDKERKPELLEQTWSALQPILTMAGVKQKLRDQALTSLVSLVPKVRDELGAAWLEQSFKDEPERGMQILAVAGANALGGLQSGLQNPSQRLKNLQLQQTAVESLLEKTPERADEWRDTVQMLALAWLRDAEVSRHFDQSTSRGPQIQRDPFGNIFYVNDMDQMHRHRGGQRDQVRPIKTADMLEVAPSEAWLAQLDDTLRPRFYAALSQLNLKVSEDEEAFPYIEQLAESFPDQARELVHEFMRVWTRNHDPNSNRRYTSRYMFSYGFNRRANGIPLTRSKQERNLHELTGWIARIRALPIDDLDQSLFAKAFTNCHSSAEVYRLEAIEDVFGPLEDLKPEMIAQLVQQMRGNLAGAWRMPAQQEEQKTKRKQKDIEAEVMRGYAVANAVVSDAFAKHPESWQLRLARACLMLDQNSYRNELAPSSKFSENRREAFDEFRLTAELYAQAVPALAENEHSTTVFEHWFYAGLGASDLNRIDHKSEADPRQPALIREAILALPGEAAERHLDMFANSLFTRISALSPAVKFAYLDAGFSIVGEAEQARDARRIYDYYKDLVTEIKFVTRVDGPAKVGHDEPFGVFVELLHTREMERESGGFGKYLQNQNNMSYAYNYGRPPENYRDKFEEAAIKALEEHFDVHSVTFQEQDVHSRAAEKYGWRVTPYAYILLTPRGPEIDKLPSLKMDLDFLDTSGYVVLPVVAPPLPLDAAPEAPGPRPYDQLTITQTLDERQAEEGKLVLEVKATAQGLVPPLEEIVDVRSSDFEVESIEDEGVLVSKFDPDSGEPAVISERTWMINYTGRTDLAALPTLFHFPEPKVATNEASFLRYNDADLDTVESTVTLEHSYGEVRSVWPWYLAAGAVVLVVVGLVIVAARRRRVEEAPAQFELPDPLTPFNVLGLLRRIESNNGFSPATRDELGDNIALLERHYFASAGGNGHTPPDLRSIAERWVAGEST